MTMKMKQISIVVKERIYNEGIVVDGNFSMDIYNIIYGIYGVM